MLIKDPPVEIVDGLWMLGTNEYPLFLYNPADRAVLFEGGVGAMGPLVLEQMDKRGLAGNKVAQIVVTHAHPDHVMAVPLLRETFTGAKVLASKTASRTLGSDKAVSFFCKIDGALTQALTKAGRITKAHHPKPLAEKRIAIDRTLKDGDTISAGDGAAFTVLETPGHSECSLSFHEPSRGILLISDVSGYYMPEHKTWWPNYFTEYGTYLESMMVLSELDAEVLCLSHNGVIKGAKDVAAYFADAIAATEAYHERIVAETKAGKDGRQLAEELGAEVYEKTQLLPLDFFQKNCSILVKQSLIHEGMIEEQ